MIKKIISNNEKETFEAAQDFAAQLKGGEVIGLVGDLGAGKTVWVRGLAAGLGIKKGVCSPTFVVMKIYNIKNKKSTIKRICHIDAYRTKSEKDLESLGIEEFLNDKSTITIIEWADLAKRILPKKSLIIKINYNSKKDQRIIKFKKI
jgi:tRNA threonylcarbamoyladenosine biosynthesis protein TsaE